MMELIRILCVEFGISLKFINLKKKEKMKVKTFKDVDDAALATAVQTFLSTNRIVETNIIHVSYVPVLSGTAVLFTCFLIYK